MSRLTVKKNNRKVDELERTIENLRKNNSRLQEQLTNTVQDLHYYQGEVLNNKAIVEKPLKALEIIKEKYVNVDLLWDVVSLEEYNSEIMFSYQILTEEEFNLLREVLK